MFYVPDELLFIRVPRTGSGAIRAGLSERYGEPNNAPFDGLHTHAFARELRARLTDEAYQGCRRFMVVRNSWERLVSLYRWSKQHGLINPKYERRGWAFPEFEKWVQMDPETPYMNKALLQSTWDGPGVEMFPFDRLGELAREFDIPLKTINASGDYDWRGYYTPRTRDLVYRLHHEDIQEFGFEF